MLSFYYNKNIKKEGINMAKEKAERKELQKKFRPGVNYTIAGFGTLCVSGLAITALATGVPLLGIGAVVGGIFVGSQVKGGKEKKRINQNQVNIRAQVELNNKKRQERLLQEQLEEERREARIADGYSVNTLFNNHPSMAQTPTPTPTPTPSEEEYETPYYEPYRSSRTDHNNPFMTREEITALYNENLEEELEQESPFMTRDEVNKRR